MSEFSAAGFIEYIQSKYPNGNIAGGSRMIETAPQAAKYMADLQRADEMAATREQRVGKVVDEVWPTEEDMREVDAMKAEYEASREDTTDGDRALYLRTMASQDIAYVIQQRIERAREEGELAARAEALYYDDAAFPVPDNAAE